MKNLSNVQKKENLEEAEIASVNNSSIAMTKMITFIGENVEILYTSKRYSSLDLMIELIEKDLTTPVPFKVHLSCSTLEAFAKAFKEIGDYELSLMIFNNIDPLNFFRLINDLSIQTHYNSSKEIANKFLTSERTLSKLNRFYNEYTDISDYCIKNNYTSLYLFEITAMNKNETLKKTFPNLSQYLHSDDKEKRHIVSSLFNELENEVRKCGITEATVNDYYYKLIRIDKEIDKIFEEIDLNLIYSIDSLYFLLYQ